MTQRSTSQTGHRGSTRHTGTEPPAFEWEVPEDRRTLRMAWVAACVLHLVLLGVNLPIASGNDLNAEAEKAKVYVLMTPRFAPPPPPPVDTPVPREPVRQIPMPDLTPHEPEEIPVDEPPLVVADLGDAVPHIPDAPPPLPTGPIHIDGDVNEPIKLFTPSPRYTEAARKVRIQGVVLLQAIIDREGNVTEVTVHKPLPMGLTENAVEAVERWRFKPATLRGKPVAVYLNLEVRFQLQ